MKEIGNIAVLLSSYKRFTDLQHQIYTMLNQDEPPQAIFVAVKGYSEYFINKFLKKKFEKFESVKIKCVPNKNQLSNLLDCIRDEDPDQFDYFLKIDDDDFYPNDYITNTRMLMKNALVNNPDIQGHGMKHVYGHLKKNANFHFFEYSHRSCFGGTLGFTRKVLDYLFKMERDRDQMKPITGDRQFAVDEMIMFFADYLGGFHTHRKREEFIYCRYNPSCWRDQKNYLGLGNCIFVGADKMQKAQEQFIYARHPEWRDTIRLCAGSFARVNEPEEKGTYLSRKNALLLKWKGHAAEVFVYHRDGYYSYKSKL